MTETLAGVALTRNPAWAVSWTAFGSTVTPEDLAYPVVCGNPLFVVGDVMEARWRGGVVVFEALGHFTLFHAIAVTLLVVWAGFKLRPIALRQTFGSSRPSLLRRLALGRPRGEPAARAARSAWASRSRSTRPSASPRRSSPPAPRATP